MLRDRTSQPRFRDEDIDGPRGAEHGVALPGVLLLAAFLVGVSGWMVGHVRSDLAVASAQDDEADAARLASAAVQAVAMALGRVPDWEVVSSLAMALPCPAGERPVIPTNAGREHAWLQADTDRGSRWGADTPLWHLLWTCHALGVHGRWSSPGALPPVLVWVADDPEGDASPLRSTNQRLWLHAVARGTGQSRATAAAVISRSAPGAPVVLESWRTGSGA
jgi:hypothetical protein